MYIGHWSKYNISVVIWHMRQCWHKGDLRGGGGVKNSPTSNVIPATSRGCFGIGPCWDLGMFQAILYISCEHNVRKNNKNKLFSTVLSWFDFAVTLRYPYRDLRITPLWNPRPTYVTMCTWVGFRPIYCKCWSNNLFFFNIIYKTLSQGVQVGSMSIFIWPATQKGH